MMPTQRYSQIHILFNHYSKKKGRPGGSDRVGGRLVVHQSGGGGRVTGQAEVSCQQQTGVHLQGLDQVWLSIPVFSDGF